MKKPIVCQIKKKKYYMYKITWIDITGEEFKKYTYKWLERVDQYYCNIGNVTGKSEKSE